MTTRGMLEPEMEVIASFLVRALDISKRIQEKAGKKLVDFIALLEDDEELKTVGAEVQAFARGFSIPGV